MESGLRIGQLSRQAGVTAKAIRFYERRHVLPAPKRAANGYRLYGRETVEMLRFVKQGTGLGLTLGEVKEIIAIRQGGRPPCKHVHRLLGEKAVELDRKLKDLLDVRRRIRRSLAAWKATPGGGAVVCAHIEYPVTSAGSTTTMKAAGRKR
jgi:DNA-binding transcriptional MerR regulator